MLDTIDHIKLQLIEHEAEAADTLLKMSMSEPEEGMSSPQSVACSSKMLVDQANDKIPMTSNSENESKPRPRTRRVHWAADVVDSSESSAFRTYHVSKRRQRRNKVSKDKNQLRGKPIRSLTEYQKQQVLNNVAKSIKRLNTRVSNMSYASSSSDDPASTTDDSDTDDQEDIAQTLMNNIRSKVTPFWDFDFSKPASWYVQIFRDLDLLIADINAKVTYLEGEMNKNYKFLHGKTKIKPEITLEQMIFITDILRGQVKYIIKHWL